MENLFKMNNRIW